MVRCGVVMFSPPVVDVQNRLGWSPCCSLPVKGGGLIRLTVRDSRRLCRPSVRASAQENSDNGPATTSTSNPEDLNAKLAAAEAEAEALRKELAARKSSPGAVQDLSKLKPLTPEKRIDGTG